MDTNGAKTGKIQKNTVEIRINLIFWGSKSGKMGPIGHFVYQSSQKVASAARQKALKAAYRKRW
jgi:hypothetical protein